MRSWRHIFRAIAEPSLGLPALLAICLFLLPLYAAPPQHAPKQPLSGMDAPPPAALESFRSLGSWVSLERRVLGNVPKHYSLEAPTAMATGSGLLPRQTPDTTKNMLALLGQWRLEGG